jgi:hypothetical protein
VGRWRRVIYSATFACSLLAVHVEADEERGFEEVIWIWTLRVL